MITIKDIAWIAGLLEGEGCFITHNSKGHDYPEIHLCMSDEDVVIKASGIMKKEIKFNKSGFIDFGSNILKRGVDKYPSNKFNKCKDQYTHQLSGNIAIQWMMTLYSLMGKRRQSKILEIINAWKKGGIERSYATR